MRFSDKNASASLADMADEDEAPMSEREEDTGLVDAMSEFLSAQKKGDAQGMADAFEAAVRACKG